jgi:hypothetical protein
MIDFDIVVVANYHRKPLILDHLGGIPHKVSYTPDYPLPSGMRKGDLGPYRCFRGHQDALKLSRTKETLVFEDDAVPNRPDWLDVVRKSIPLLAEAEIVSLHSRDYDPVQFRKVLAPDGTAFLAPNSPGREVRPLGSLAYLIREDAKKRFLEMIFDGYPMDLLIANRFSFRTICHSPFNHDRSQGSLVDKYERLAREEQSR